MRRKAMLRWDFVVKKPPIFTSEEKRAQTKNVPFQHRHLFASPKLKFLNIWLEYWLLYTSKNGCQIAVFATCVLGVDRLDLLAIAYLSTNLFDNTRSGFLSSQTKGQTKTKRESYHQTGKDGLDKTSGNTEL